MSGENLFAWRYLRLVRDTLKFKAPGFIGTGANVSSGWGWQAPHSSDSKADVYKTSRFYEAAFLLNSVIDYN